MAVGSAKPSPISTPSQTTSRAEKTEARESYLVGALILLGIVSLIRILLIRNLPLTGDEAYYWQWSKHLALGYHDHPPLVGWLIRAGSLFGQGAFWVRFPSLVLAFLGSLFFFLFVREITQSGKSAFQALSLLIAIPIFSVCALAIFPDAPLVFSWSFFLWASWKWLSDEKYWPWMGAALGLAALSKLMGLFLFPSLLMFLVSSNRERMLLRRASLWKSLGLGLLLASPFLYWNAQHHFETFTYQAHQRLTHSISPAPFFFFNYVSLQFASLSPIVFVLFLGTLYMLIQKSLKGDIRSRFLLWMALPIHLSFLLISFLTRVGLHWALPGYLSILAASPLWIETLNEKRKSLGTTFFYAALSSSLVLTLFFLSLLAWPQKLVPWIASLGLHHQGVNQGKTIDSQTITEILGYQELGDRVDKELSGLTDSTKKQTFVFSDSYSLSSIMSFYAHHDAKTLLFTSTGGEYDRWNHFEDYQGNDALYVDTQPIGSRPDINQILHQAFLKVVPLEPLRVDRGRLETRTFYFAHCVTLVNPRALRPNWPW